MDYERFKEGFQDALKAELAVRGADVELTARRVDKMNESYDAKIPDTVIDNFVDQIVFDHGAFIWYLNPVFGNEVYKQDASDWKKNSICNL